MRGLGAWRRHSPSPWPETRSQNQHWWHITDGLVSAVSMCGGVLSEAVGKMKRLAPETVAFRWAGGVVRGEGSVNTHERIRRGVRSGGGEGVDVFDVVGDGHLVGCSFTRRLSLVRLYYTRRGHLCAVCLVYLWGRSCGSALPLGPGLEFGLGNERECVLDGPDGDFRGVAAAYGKRHK